MIKIDHIKDLAELDEVILKLFTDHIKAEGETPSGFANSVDVHPLQMLRVINEKKHFQISTLVKIGKKMKLITGLKK